MKSSAFANTASQSLSTKRGCKDGVEEGDFDNASWIELDPSLLATNRHRCNTIMNDLGSVNIWICLALSMACVLGSLRFLSPSLPWLDGLIHATARYLPVHDTRFSEVTTMLFESNGRTDQVQWDKYSLIIRGQRVFLHSGEFHTFRLPVPSLWLDILQKVKVAGLKAVSIYTHMGLINPQPGVVDFDGFRDLQPLFDAAKQTGIWIILRPGPYINAETTAGGLSHWITSEVGGTLRTNATDFRAAWHDYIQGIIKVTASNQITSGGPVIAIQIDNEYFQSRFGQAEYFAQLEEAYRNSGINVLLTYNDPGEGRNFVNGTGAVDIYGLDSYPQGFDCSNPTDWAGVITNYNNYHQNTNPRQPFYFPEFQGGSFNAWGPTAPGYEPCLKLTGPDFQSVFNLNLWAANAKLINYYMIYGGTSWGAIPFHGVYTSYDYGSAIAESRSLTSKYHELKRQGLFLRSSLSFYKTDYIGNTTTGAVSTNSSSVFGVHLHNPDVSTSFYIVRQNDSTAMNVVNFKINVTTSVGNVQLPQIASSVTLGGRQSKVIVTDYVFGASKLLYTTAQILFAGQIGSCDVLFLYGDTTQEHETSLILTGISRTQTNGSAVSFTMSNSKETIINFLSGIEGLVILHDSDTQLIMYGDKDTAATFWAPVISADDTPFANYWQVGTNISVLIGGPYLCRNANISGSKLVLRGDLQTGVRLIVVAPDNIASITWNGYPVSADAAFTTSSMFVGWIQPKTSVSFILPPKLDNWKFANSLPGILENFSDASWTIANHTTTNIPYKPYYGDRVLYGCDYKFCENIVLWRGHFNATGNEKSVNLSINGGEAFAASVWVNDVFLNTSYGKFMPFTYDFPLLGLIFRPSSTNNNNIIEETDDIFIFPNGSLSVGKDNVITIVQDNMGLNETDGVVTDTSKSPRGIRGFQLNSGNFTKWKVQGKLGGYTDYPDKV
ncbi:glycoside hydrolase family 35 protein [Piloderma croceum F 1598]|uniref:beta-galactosidase n=1 Tax=Piloderma croceum (strain F 1598) TaxID=765440 RepID=A0A0C3F050_PILCF|nr:glycoside hydrolase family 35 protein [Piloderma croceum F 1598]